jgi:hypothetical protein
MTRTILIFFITLIIISCSSKQEKRIPNFYTIDLSRSDGWYFFYSIHLDSTGSYLIKKVYSPKKFEYFKGHLADTILDKIIILTDSIDRVNYDTLYEPDCLDCPFYKIIVNSKKRKQQVMSFGYHLKSLDNLVHLFTEVTNSPQVRVTDTTFEFESFKRFLAPMAEQSLVGGK